MNLAIIGTGYVGLVSGVCLASKGHKVTCVDTNLEIVNQLNSGQPHIYEKGLKELLKSVIVERTFRATTNLDEALKEAELVMIAVGTPSENGVIDLKFVKKVAGSIGDYIKRNNRSLCVVIKSTVIPGTTDTFVKNEIEKYSGRCFPEFGLGMNPEFLREGEALEDFLYPDRIVLGYEDEKTLGLLEKLYEPWDSVDKIKVNTRTAELIKYTNNALLALQISAINEISNLAAKFGGIDVMDVVKGVHLDKRWSPIADNGERIRPKILDYLIPGCGFGGSCFPKDVQALLAFGESNGEKMQMMNSILKINELQPYQVVEIIGYDVPELSTKKILVLGLAFKPETDDVRESASIKIIESFIKKGAHVIAHDPIATENFKSIAPELSEKIEFIKDWKTLVEQVDIIIVATRWDEYLELTNINLAGKLLFDARRMFATDNCGGASYRSIGIRI